MSDAIKKQYGVNMSKQTLINYENAEEFSTKAGAAKGMSAERMATLADYFGVSADYLLGISDSPSIRENMRIAQRHWVFLQPPLKTFQKSQGKSATRQ